MKGRTSGNYGNYGERLYVEGLMELEKRRAAVRAWHRLWHVLWACGCQCCRDSERPCSQYCWAVGRLKRKCGAGLRDWLPVWAVACYVGMHLMYRAACAGREACCPEQVQGSGRFDLRESNADGHACVAKGKGKFSEGALELERRWAAVGADVHLLTTASVSHGREA